MYLEINTLFLQYDIGSIILRADTICYITFLYVLHIFQFIIFYIDFPFDNLMEKSVETHSFLCDTIEV